MIVLVYLACGVALMGWFASHHAVDEPAELHVAWHEWVVGIAIWPFLLAYFLMALLVAVGGRDG